MPLYLHLFHGRADPEDLLSDWGTDGPTIGPFDTFHSTYCNALELWRGEASFELSTSRSVIRFGGVFYGDLEIVEAPPSTPVLSLEDAGRVTHAHVRGPSLLEPLKPLVSVFVDAVRSQHGDELARRLELTLTAALR